MLVIHLFTYSRYLLARVRHDERGQASAEYALVLLGAAAVALLITAWATNTDLVGKLLDTVLKHITGQAG
jgi:Flp pilus assembly pilin Flp